jgi:hypothetical protein
VITAPTGGSAGVIPAVVYSLGEGGAKLPEDKIREGLLVGAVVGYLCKHNATLSAAEGGCQAEIGVASAMGAALIAVAYGDPPQVAANGAEGALEHHLGMTCDPVAGICSDPLHRALRVRRGQVVDGVPDCRQRNTGKQTPGLRHNGRCDGTDRQRDELEVQGDLRRRFGGVCHALLRFPLEADGR